jgi:hypothetical protein
MEITTVPKNIVITSIDASLYSQGVNGFEVGVFTAGTTPGQALVGAGQVAGTFVPSSITIESSGGSSYRAIALLYASPTARWLGTGSGYVVYLALTDGSNVKHYYQHTGVSIDVPTIGIAASTFTSVAP